ncbi:MAG: helix-turn-helix domain-containing protein, partial [Bacteroidales bacterium]|nr:helix-turn-helix domain-containing protein [Bacteroidales bacterium]
LAMKKHPSFLKIKEFVFNLAQITDHNHTQIPLSKFGAINCRYKQRITEVPFLYPTLIILISGEKTIYFGNKEIQCFPGEFLAIPAPLKLDAVNIPDTHQGSFLAFYIYFDNLLIEQFCRFYKFDESIKANNNSIHFEGNELLYSSICHLLEISQQTEPDDDFLKHRLMDVLLCLVKCCDSSHMLLSMSQKWSERIYSLLLSNPSRSWHVKNVCNHLRVSESTLRRNLRKENTDFRTIIDDVRMGIALSEVQFTNLSISAIALNCGYSSFSRFTSRFQQRFGTTPSQLRKSMTVSG